MLLSNHLHEVTKLSKLPGSPSQVGTSLVSCGISTAATTSAATSAAMVVQALLAPGRCSADHALAHTGSLPSRERVCTTKVHVAAAAALFSCWLLSPPWAAVSDMCSHNCSPPKLALTQYHPNPLSTEINLWQSHPNPFSNHHTH